MTARIIATANEKGGAGKTTTAVMSAHEAVARGQRALIVELDGQRNASQWLTGRDFTDWFEWTMASVLDTKLSVSMRARLSDIIVPSIRDGLDVAPAADNRRMDQVNHTVRGRGDGALAVRAAIRDVREQYDLIIVDCAPTTTPLNVAGYVAAEAGILVVAEPKQASHAGAISLLTAIDDLNDPKADENLTEVVGRDIPIAGIVLNNYNPHKVSHREFRRDLEELAESFEAPLIGPPVPALSLMELVPPAGIGLDQVTGARDHARAEEIRASYAAILETIA